MTKKSTVAATLAAIALAAAPKPFAAAPSEPPRTLAEAYAQQAKASGFYEHDWPYYDRPPVNVQAEDHEELFGDRVMISEMYEGETLPAGLKIIFIGRDGRYLWCARSGKARPNVYLTNHSVWRSTDHRHRGQVVPLFLGGRPEYTSVDQYAWFAPLYDAATGEITWYKMYKRFWWDWDRGHLQERLPAVTWTLCPDFPPAGELGVGVNRAQTAATYPELVAQDPGRRVLRPDLVTAGAATGQGRNRP